jgi:membrane-associated phospholipid phosphatase
MLLRIKSRSGERLFVFDLIYSQYICAVIKDLKTEKMQQFFRVAVATSFSFALAVAAFLIYYGKQGSFVIINGYYHPTLDIFFQYITYLGDGLIYIPIALYCLVYNRKYLVAVIAGIIICTIITHFLKRVIFPDELRPISLEAKHVIIHKIKGVPINREHSFPSGHTSTAFSMALLLAAIMRRKIWCFVLPLIAFMVGYSRVYLSQHFVTDVFAGMTIGIVTAYLSLLIYFSYLKRREQKQPTISK